MYGSPSLGEHAPEAGSMLVDEQALRPAWPATALRLVFLGACLLVCAALPAWIIGHFVFNAYRHGSVPFDLAVFLHAAHRVVSGHSPYPSPHALSSDTSFVYPPLLAFLVWPFAALPAGPAVLLWTLLSVASVAGGLWLLGVRDWRCYGLAFLWPPTRAAIALGTVGPVLLLLVALVWRFRDRRPLVAALAAAAAITFKLFLWPLVVWLAATRRIRAAVAALAAAVLLALVSWAAVGFAGLADYPSLLRRLSQLESAVSYSPYAAARTAAVAWGLPTALAWPAALLLGAGLLAAAVYWTLRGTGTPRQRDGISLTLALAAALALTPLLWVHYLVLLLVPVALARPRLAPVWVAPLVVYALEPSGWDLHAWAGARVLWLAVVLGMTALVIAEALRGQADWRPRHGRFGP